MLPSWAWEFAEGTGVIGEPKDSPVVFAVIELEKWPQALLAVEDDDTTEVGLSGTVPGNK